MRRAHPIVPVGLNRIEAAQYVGVSPAIFDKLVRDGRMPKPRAISERRLAWSRLELEEAFHDLPSPSDRVGVCSTVEDGGVNPWDATLP